MGRRLLAVWLCALVSVLPSALADPDPAYRGTTYTVSQVVDLTTMVEVDQPLLPTAPLIEPLACYQEEHFTFNASAGWFKFIEGVDEGGCDELQLVLTVPPGAARVELTFRVDRTLRDQVTTGLAVDFVQELRIYPPGQTTPNTEPLFDSAAGQQFGRPYSTTIETPGPGIRVGWFFLDNGATAASLTAPLAGYAYESVVSDVVLHYAAIPLPGGDVRTYRESTRDAALFDTRVEAPVTPAMLEQGAIELDFAIANTHSLNAVHLPDGSEVPTADLRTSEGDGVLHVFVAATEPGVYVASFASSEAHATTWWMLPAVLALMIAPVPAGVYAAQSARRFGREAVGGFRGTARTLVYSLWFLTMVYAGLLFYVFLARIFPLVVAWPLRLEAAMLHIGFAMTTFGFLGMGIYWRRTLAKVMEADLAEKAEINRNLERSNQELEQFAYIASHDLQEPLRTITNFTQLLARRYEGKLDEEADEFVGFIVDGTNQMKALINDLLLYSRVGSKRRPFEPVDLAATMEMVRDALMAMIEDEKADVSWGALPLVQADPVQMAQLFQNLISNAIKFRHPRRRPRIRVDAEKEATGWCLRVSDNGIGIEPAYFERIFVVFQRLQRTEDKPGTGIGLAICKKIVERHGGRLRVESVAGKGSTFLVRLPFTPQES